MKFGSIDLMSLPFAYFRTGYTKMYLDFVGYSNLKDLKASGVKCDTSNRTDDFCDIVVEICISDIGKT